MMMRGRRRLLLLLLALTGRSLRTMRLRLVDLPLLLLKLLDEELLLLLSELLVRLHETG